MDEKNLLLISHFPPPYGGIASWTKRVLELGLPNGWNIFHVNSNTINGRDPFQNTKRNIFDELKRTKNILKKEKEYLKNNNISVVQTCIPCTFFGCIRERFTARLAKKYKVKYILHCRCTVNNVVKKSFHKFVFKGLLKKCDGVIVLNEQSRMFVEKYSKKNCLVETIPNFVNFDEVVDNKVINKKMEDLVYVGGVTKEKGCSQIIRISEKFPDLKFHLIGIVSEEIQKCVKPQNVILYGPQNRDYIKNEIKSKDCFLFLSHYFGEGFSNSLVEAMAAGLPCIVTDWAANKDMIEDKGGIIIDSDEELINAIESMRNLDLRSSFSQWNIQKVKESYIESIVLDRYTKFYEKLLIKK